LAEEKLKKAKLNKYSKIKSRIGSTHLGSRKVGEHEAQIKPVEREQKWDLGNEFPESPTSIKHVGNIQDISMIQHIYDEQSAFGHGEIQASNDLIPNQASLPGSSKLKSNIIKPVHKSNSNHTYMVQGELAPKINSQSKSSGQPFRSTPVSKIANQSNSGMAKSNNTKSLKPPVNATAGIGKIAANGNPSNEYNDQLVSKVLQVLGSKLDPMLAQVQKHWENATAQIDEKIASALEKHDEAVQEPLLADMEEPSILVESETQFFQVTNAKDESPEPERRQRNYQEFDNGEILIQRELDFIPKEPALAPQQRKVLALPATVIEDIIKDQSKRQKWRETYYGAGFDPVSAIER
jgi:hypothetical protein